MQLHHYPATAAMIPQLVLEEIGCAYELIHVDRGDGAHKTPAYLQLNPNGLLPTLVDGDLVLYETAAILLHLVDTQPQAQLAPPVGTAARAHFYKWLVWCSSTLQPALIAFFYPERWVDDGDDRARAQVQAHAEQRVAGLLLQLDAELARHGGPWFLGSGYSAVDAYVFTLCRWTRNFRREQPARGHAHLGAYLERMLARPAVQRVLAHDRLNPPYV